MVVHLGTEIECSFGILDTEGNIRAPKTFSFTLESHNDGSFNQLRQLIEIKKSEYLDSFLPPSPLPTEAVEGELVQSNVEEPSPVG